ncbi:hypothetical protein LSO07_28010 [Janthinobacterium sp. PLB04]|uniref:Uncharacterized protein n=1 Tax=Janthinobacterium lividum TaxID=29581 RepID=A0AAJ4MSJ9_9BURK|nr:MULTISPECIES: hypothetical protein [Janthinobacterium]KAB0327224.1 hypothetical protein F3B38_27650 [Janthinobacterium lividum]QSX96369.1 hypothetical protein J3P46_27855 [Janthinobacterium lividum]UGQ36252.1 hypothetical protein LSO07_28010 [Janthinobacterium sp. PLB04]
MKRFLWAGVMAGVTALAGAADFSRGGSDSIAMRGPIAEGDVDKLRLLAAPGMTLLRVNSDAGDPLAAMQLGRLVSQLQLDIAIDTVCAGSCALYVFPAARRKHIPADAVLALQESAFLRAQANRASMRRSLVEAGVATEDLDSETAVLAAQLAQTAALEAAFSAELGIVPAFYRDFRQVATQADSVRLRFPDQEAAVYWWPAAARLQRCYGIAGVDEGTRATRLALDGYLYVPALSALVMGDQGLQACP